MVGPVPGGSREEVCSAARHQPQADALAAIFLSNFPKGLSSAVGIEKNRRRTVPIQPIAWSRMGYCTGNAWLTPQSRRTSLYDRISLLTGKRTGISRQKAGLRRCQS